VMQLRQGSQVIRRVPDWSILKKRVWTISPKIQTGGIIGKVLAKMANVLMFVNGWLALNICRFFRW